MEDEKLQNAARKKRLCHGELFVTCAPLHITAERAGARHGAYSVWGVGSEVLGI